MLGQPLAVERHTVLERGLLRLVVLQDVVEVVLGNTARNRVLVHPADDAFQRDAPLAVLS